MSIAQIVPPRRVDSPLASNNPFRNRIGSQPNNQPSSATTARPISTNPFLDSTELPPAPAPVHGVTDNASPVYRRPTDVTADLLSHLNINGKSQSPNRGPPPTANGVPRRENIPPQQGRFPSPHHKPSASDEDRRRQQLNSRDGLRTLDIFADPPELSRLREKRFPRRNSESSVKDKPAGLLDSEEEKKRRERKYRESRRVNKPRQPSKRLDIIDKLDVTSIYGMGLFHHDGPFDACNPIRNRKGSKQAPMQAFPKDSLNMKLGGSGPLKKNIDLEEYHGRGQEAHIDYNEAAVVDDEHDYFRRAAVDRGASFDPVSRIEPVHGIETAGLGTSTFLDGAPASRAAIQRRESEMEAAQLATTNNLSRKKSIAMKIRGVRPNRTNSPEALQNSPLNTGRSEGNGNPFFKEFDQDWEKKGAQIAFAEEQKPGRARAPSSPSRGLVLERRVTQDSIGEEGRAGGGFLSRVKSLKGGRRQRPERRDTNS